MADTLSVADYIVFGLMLLISSAIGVYYGRKGKQTTTKEYLTASGSMHWMPISISLLASFLSAIALMGIPSEIYTYGIQYLITYISFVAMLLLSAVIYAPIFYQTKVTSANEYLEKRFSRPVRLVGCVLFILQYILYLAVVIFAPSLALQAVAGVPMAASIISTGLVCTFYTTLGGMRAVVWTDVFQAFVMILGLIIIIVIGANEVGGLGRVVDLADKGERLTLFDFNPDPKVRNTFWTLVIGGTFSLIPNWTTSQVVVQRFLSASSLKSVKKALYVNVIFLLIFMIACCFAGLVMYAVYADCDLRTVGIVKSNDQIIPYFVVHKLSHLKGVPGIYMACLFSGALSTASSGLNSLTAVTVEDLIKPRFPDMSPGRLMLVSKLVGCAFGVIVIALSFLASVAGTLVLQLAYSITGIIGAPNFGMFTLGMFSTRAHSKGALCGVLTGIAMTTWISLGGILYPGDKAPAPLKVTECSAVGVFNTSLFKNVGANGTVAYKYKPHDFPLANLYSLSYLWYGAVGALCTIVIGWLVSIATSSSDQQKQVDESLMFDYKSTIYRIVPARWTKFRLKHDMAMDFASTHELKQYAEDIDVQNVKEGKNSNIVIENPNAF